MLWGSAQSQIQSLATVREDQIGSFLTVIHWQCMLYIATLWIRNETELDFSMS